MMARVIVPAFAASVLALALASWRWNRALKFPPQDVAELPVVAQAPQRQRIEDSVLDALVERDMFRLPMAAAVGPARASGATLDLRPSSLPALTLRAIVGGPPWRAIVDGMPGQSGGVIVQSGSVFGSVSITAVDRDSVRIRSGDTAWTLSYRRSP